MVAKKIVAVSMAVMMGLSMTVPVQAEEWTEWQVKSHIIADMAREMGLPEENPIIKECGRIWWEEAVRLTREAEERAEQEAAQKEFLDEHYNDAVMMAKVMYCEARGINDKRELSMICWTILNRYDSGRFGKTISEIITSPKQFSYKKSAPTVNDEGIDLLKLAQDVLVRWKAEKDGQADVGRTLPAGYCFYKGDGKHNYFQLTDKGKGYLWFEGYGDPYK